MPSSSDQQGGGGGSFLGRISIRRNQIASVDTNHDQLLESIDLFQKHVSDRFSNLLLLPPHPHPHLLSISWIRTLLDTYLCCESEFKAALFASSSRSRDLNTNRLLSDLLDRSLKTLDLCNAISHGLDSLRSYQTLAEIAVLSLQPRPIYPGAVRRAQRALSTLLSSISSDEIGSPPPPPPPQSSKSTERTSSMGKRAIIRGPSRRSTLRSLSWTVSRTWSAAKQVQAMAAGLGAPPRGGEVNGTGAPVHLMSSVMVLVMWVLVACVPCQERGGLTGVNLGLPKNAGWAKGMVWLQERVGEELRKKEKRRSGAGLVGEMEELERIGQWLVEFSEEEEEEVVASRVADLKEVCRRMEEGLMPLQRQVREVFRRTVKSRSELLAILDHSKPSSSPLV